jgi:hypothetical protein
MSKQHIRTQQSTEDGSTTWLELQATRCIKPCTLDTARAAHTMSTQLSTHTTDESASRSQRYVHSLCQHTSTEHSAQLHDVHNHTHNIAQHSATQHTPKRAPRSTHPHRVRRTPRTW